MSVGLQLAGPSSGASRSVNVSFQVPEMPDIMIPLSERSLTNRERRPGVISRSPAGSGVATDRKKYQVSNRLGKVAFSKTGKLKSATSK